MNTETTAIETSQDLFAEHDLYQFTYASTWQRFFNLLIDTIVMRFVLSFATAKLLVFVLNTISPNLSYKLFVEDSDKVNLFIAAYLITIINYLFYYTFCEKVFNGYTLGKLVTGTRAVREDGQELTFRNAILRSLCRMVPFEPFSGFGGHPWHDNWTGTMVVKSR
jgi:uncharacterized RDD family membrane protein YckC